MRRYETIVIVDPDLSEDDRTSLFTRIKNIIPQQGGVLVQEDLWGSKKLAYEIKKKPRGYYVRFDYCGMGGVVDEMERFFRIDDRVMKYLTVQLTDEADPEQIKAEMEASETTDEAPAETPAATAKDEAKPAESETEPAASEATTVPEASEETAPAEPSEAETTTETSEKE